MISANFAVAVVTVVLRGLLDRILTAFQAPMVKNSLFPQSTGIVLVSATLLLIYNHLTNGRRIQISYSGTNNRRPKILNGCVHKNGSQSSSASNLRQHRDWLSRKFRSHRSRSRCRNNLLQAAKDSLQMLHHDCSSTCSLSSKSAPSLQCRCMKDNSTERIVTKEQTPSVYSIKSDGENPLERIEIKNEEQNFDRFKGFGDCDWEERRPKSVKKRKRVRTTRKTRSGKIYSSLL